jgi:integrase
LKLAEDVRDVIAHCLAADKELARYLAVAGASCHQIEDLSLGSPEDPNVIGRRFGRRIRDLARLPAIGLHGLRHTHATLLLEEGVDVKTVSERLGHDSVQTTLELYGHVTPKMRANAATRFGSLLSNARVGPPTPR